MLLESLTTLNYRNLAAGTLYFPPGVSAVWGPNGAGKTNLLEATYLALTGLSDVSRLEQLILQGEGEAYVRAQLLQGGSLSVLEVGLGRGRGWPPWGVRRVVRGACLWDRRPRGRPATGALRGDVRTLDRVRSRRDQ